MPRTNSRIGAEEMTCSECNDWRFPCSSLNWSVQVWLGSSYAQPTTLQPMKMLPPSAVVLRAHSSHIMPGPLRGYLKQLIKVLITWFGSFGCFFGRSAFLIALPNERPLMRCAAQSAEISLHGMPQTFSV